MERNIIKKTVLIKGDKGEYEESGEDTTVPLESIIAFDGETIPEGYELFKEV